MKAFETLIEERVQEEASRCLLCYDAPCSKACPHKCNPSSFVRSEYFDNRRGAVKTAGAVENSLECAKTCTNKYCEKACIRGKLDRPVEIQMIHEYLATLAEERK